MAQIPSKGRGWGGEKEGGKHDIPRLDEKVGASVGALMLIPLWDTKVANIL
jgi:hypothetical protein